MHSIKQAKKGQVAQMRFCPTAIHHAILSLFPVLKGGDIGEWKSYWREFAFNTAVRQQDPDLFRECYLRSEVLKRYQEGTISAAERSKAAVARLLADECYNKLTVPRLVDWESKPSTPNHIARALYRARAIVADILGPFSWERLYQSCGYSSGASTEHRREEAHVQLKWESSTHITANASMAYAGWLQWASGNYPCSELRTLQTVPGNVIFTVPKNYAVDRSCAKEPPLNMFLQKGYGSMIRPALNRRGLLLRDAKEHHMALADEGSRTGLLATLDGESASNSVTCALIATLLPADHVSCLAALRSPKGFTPDGQEITWEMLSSMGNGFTFEIETLIFYALARAVCGNGAVVSVFGDDVVVPSDRYEQVAELFEFCGFRINRDKSFSAGPFRESCGGHYFAGHDVTPFYIEELPKSQAEALDLHNRILEWVVRGGDPTPFWPLINAIREQIPRSFRGPFGESGTLWSNWDQATPSFHTTPNENKPSYRCWSVKAFVKKVPSQRHEYLYGALLSSLWVGITNRENARKRHTHGRPWQRQVSPKVAALLYRAVEQREASKSELTFAREGKWGVSKRLLRCSRQWSSVPVTGWVTNSVR